MSPQEHTCRIEERRQLLHLLEQNIVLLRQMVSETQQRVEEARRAADPKHAGYPKASATTQGALEAQAANR
jgi:hypothetical protein